ncbi:hypothetical protein NDU88_004173 [Pleurodeles waltl]|uniref:Uncharacterized protein n=1 Tax=Pleurodeles waltl TaxID=8319 RepID=A0AAV7V4G3_PLEWA|nr:hypothetical protein NDU88_004173 [Pleurodeles waltl]
MKGCAGGLVRCDRCSGRTTRCANLYSKAESPSAEEPSPRDPCVLTSTERQGALTEEPPMERCDHGEETVVQKFPKATVPFFLAIAADPHGVHFQITSRRSLRTRTACTFRSLAGDRCGSPRRALSDHEQAIAADPHGVHFQITSRRSLRTPTACTFRSLAGDRCGSPRLALSDHEQAIAADPHGVHFQITSRRSLRIPTACTFRSRAGDRCGPPRRALSDH